MMATVKSDEMNIDRAMAFAERVHNMPLHDLESFIGEPSVSHENAMPEAEFVQMLKRAMR